MISTIGKKLVNLQGLPYTPPNLVNFGSETAENGWRIFAYPVHLAVLPVKFNFCRKKSATKFLCVKTSSGKVVLTSLPY